VLNVPNALSCIRLLVVPVLLALAWSGHSRTFFVCLIISVLTDAADGWLARRLNQATELGARLDSWSDFATWLALPFCVWWLRPDVIREQAPYLAVAILVYLVAIAFGFLKYGRLTSYHTWGAKLIAVIMAVAALVLFGGGPGWPLRVVVPVVVLSQIEEILITALLPAWRANVPSLWHAWKIKAALTIKK
jgi:phosphatidylglycerophosphate synthase